MEGGYDGLLASLGLLCLIIYDYFKRSHNEVSFVMNESDCECNPSDSYKTCHSKYCRNNLKLKIKNKIDEALKEILIAMYTLTNDDLIDSILNAKKRGVKIRIIVDKSTSENGQNLSNIRKLTDEGTSLLAINLPKVTFCFGHFVGVEVRKAGKGREKMHNKFCVIDAKFPYGVVITGSLNWTFYVRIF